MDMAANRSSFFNRTLSMAFAFSGGVAVTTLFGFLANALVGFNSQLEQAHIAFTTLLGSASAANTFIKKMQDFANVTPFDYKGVQESAQRLLAMGFAANQVLPALRAIGDAVSGLGGDRDVLQRITMAIGEMSTAGRINARNMRELTMAGIPAWDILSKAIGKTIAETRKLSEQGLLPAAQNIGALLGGMEERFSGMMARQARTAQGAFSTIRDVAIQTISGAVQPAFDALSNVMVGIADFLLNGGGRYVAPVIYGIGTALAVALIPRMYGLAVSAEVASIALGTTAEGLALFTIPIMPLIVAVTALGIAWQENFGGMRDTLQPVVTALTDSVGSVIGLVNASGLLVPAIEILVAVITIKLVAGLVQAGIAMTYDAVAAFALSGAFDNLAFSEVAVGTAGTAAALGVTAVGASATAAIVPVLVLIAAFEALKNIKIDMGPFGDALSTARGDKLPPGFLPGSGTATPTAPTKPAAPETIDYKTLFGQGLAAGADALEQSTLTMVQAFGSSMQSVLDAIKDNGDRLHKAGSDAMLELAKGIQSAQDAPGNALKVAMEMTAKAVTPAIEIARNVGILMSSALAEGLKSTDPAAVAAWSAVQKAAIEALDSPRLTNGAFTAGTAVGKAHEAGLRAALASEINAPAGKVDLGQELHDYQALGALWLEKFAPSASAAAAAYNKLVTEIASGSTTVANATGDIVAKFGNNIAALKEIGQTAGASLMASVAQGIAQNQDAPLNAMKDLIGMEKAAMAPAKQEALLVGILISKNMADGLASSTPGVVAQAIATSKFIMDQLNLLQPGAYAAGAGAIMALASGMINSSAFTALNKAAAAVRLVMATATGDPVAIKAAIAGVSAAVNLVVPSFGAAKSAADAWFSSLKTGAASASSGLKTLSGDAKDKMKQAFADMKSAAKSFFDSLHDRNLKAIEDARDLRNAELDAVVDTAQSALNAQRNAIRLRDLNEALAKAQTPEDQRSAWEALNDFQQQQRIDAMQVDVNEQKKANDALVVTQKAAEDARYGAQVAAFNRELGILQRHLMRHPEEWRRMQAKVLSLLASFGITYISAGAALGADFATGLKNSVGAAVSAAHTLAGTAARAFNSKFKADIGIAVPTPPPLPKKPSAVSPVHSNYQTGAWKLLTDELAYLHQGEMVVPPDIAALIRDLVSRPSSMRSSPAFMTMASGSGLGSTRAGTTALADRSMEFAGGGGTIIVQVGADRIGELTDRRLHISQGVHAPGQSALGGSSR
jgi:tape measure domain-containing protein